MSSAAAASPITIRKRGVVGVIVRDERLLVIRRSQWVRAPGMHCFPGGGIEASETEAEALSRELQEELSVAGSGVRRIWESVTPWGVHLAWWLAAIKPDSPIVPNAAEVEAVVWLSPAEIRALPNVLASNLEFLDALERGEIAPIMPPPAAGQTIFRPQSLK